MPGDTPEAVVKLPRLLFRYLRDDAYLLETVLTPYLWFSDPSSLNDPFDLANLLDMNCTPDELVTYMKRTRIGQAFTDADTERIASTFRTDEDAFRNAQRKILAAVHKVYLQQVALCCFSFDCDSTLMWSLLCWESHRNMYCSWSIAPSGLRIFGDKSSVLSRSPTVERCKGTTAIWPQRRIQPSI